MPASAARTITFLWRCPRCSLINGGGHVVRRVQPHYYLLGRPTYWNFRSVLLSECATSQIAKSLRFEIARKAYWEHREKETSREPLRARNSNWILLFCVVENDLNSEKNEEFTSPLPTAMFPILLPLIEIARISPKSLSWEAQIVDLNRAVLWFEALFKWQPLLIFNGQPTSVT